MDKFITRTPKPSVQAPVDKPGPSGCASQPTSSNALPSSCNAQSSTSAPSLKRKDVQPAAALHQPEPVAKKVAKKQQPKSRSFQEQWRVGRDWLVFHYQKKLMFCTVCQEKKDLLIDPRLKLVQKDGNFIEGSSNFKYSAIKDHEVSKAHMKAKLASDADKAPAETSVAGQTLVKLKKIEHTRLQHLFKNAYAIGKHNRLCETPHGWLIWTSLKA